MRFEVHRDSVIPMRELITDLQARLVQHDDEEVAKEISCTTSPEGTWVEWQDIHLLRILRALKWVQTPRGTMARGLWVLLVNDQRPVEPVHHHHLIDAEQNIRERGR